MAAAGPKLNPLRPVARRSAPRLSIAVVSWSRVTWMVGGARSARGCSILSIKVVCVFFLFSGFRISVATGLAGGGPAIDHMLGALFSHVKLLNRKLREQSNLFNAIWLLNIIGSHWKLDQRQPGWVPVGHFLAEISTKPTKRTAWGVWGPFFGGRFGRNTV